MAKTKRSKKQKGGKYVGQGTYGCGFKSPALPCKNRERPYNTLSKLVQQETADEEEVVNEQFRILDPEKKYFLSSTERCEFNPANFQVTNEKEKCSLMFPPPGKEVEIMDPYLIQMPEGGRDLEQITIIPSDVIPFFESLENLFDGLDKAHKKSIFHMDVKPPNMVSKKLPDGKFHTRFIDFGLSLFPGKAAEDVYSSHYKFWSPETMFLYNSHLDDNAMKEHLTFWKNTQESFYKYLRPPSEKYTKYFYSSPGIRPAAIIMYKIVQNITTRQKLGSYSDVFGLGISLAIILHRIFGHYWPQVDPNNLKVEFNEAVTQEVKNWHIQVIQQISKPLFNLVKNMTDIDFNLRLSAIEARDIFKTILPAIHALCTKENIQKNVVEAKIKYKHGLRPMVTDEPIYLNNANTNLGAIQSNVFGESPQSPNFGAIQTNLFANNGNNQKEIDESLLLSPNTPEGGRRKKRKTHKRKGK